MMSGNEEQLGPSPADASLCPICSCAVPVDVPSFPFCSDRCKLVDLGRWAGEMYRISRPIEHGDEDEV